MAKKRVSVKAKQAKRLLTDLNAQPKAPMGPHLTDEELIEYATETLASEHIESHLASCSDCATKVERLIEASKAWQGEPGERRLAELRTRTHPERSREAAQSKEPTPATLLAQLRDFLSSFWHQPALPSTATAQTASAAPLELETPDGQISLFMQETENGDLILRLDSRALELAGVEIALSAGDWQRVVQLSPVAENYVGAEIRLTREERKALPSEAVLQARIISPSGD